MGDRLMYEHYYNDKEDYKRPNVSHYKQGGIEPIDFINSHNLNFNLGNVVKYIVRSPYKGTQLEDLKKARDYINFEIERLQK